MKHLLTAVAMLISVCSFGQAKEQRTVADFSGISASTGLEVEVTQGNENAVWVTASDEKYLGLVQTKVEDGVLKIYHDDPKHLYSKEKNKKLKALVTFRSLSNISVSSGANITGKNTITGNSFTLETNSGASFDGAFKMSSLKIEQNSGATTKLSGSATEVKADLSSGAVVQAADLMSETCKVKASSGAVLRIGVSKKLVASATTGAVIGYKGDAEVQKSLNLGGTVSKM